MPFARPGQTIGLLGGSFDPPHSGHVHITKHALTRFALDRVWWLVSPGNPLKSEGPASLSRRLTAARDLATLSDVFVTDIEAKLGIRHTALTISALKSLYPGVRFVWLMGADNLASFHKWERWQDIMHTVSVGVVARPGTRTAARHARAATIYRSAQLRGRDSRLLKEKQVPCWCFVNLPMVNLSSTEIRQRGEWQR